MMRPTFYLRRILALLLTLVLGLSGPAGVHAEPGRSTLRPTEVIEQTTGLEELQQALGVRSPAAVIHVGLEEPVDPAKVLRPRWEGEEIAIQILAHRIQPMMVFVGDLDGLGGLNMVYSKPLVNPVLTHVFEILRRELKDVYRNGGDEFAGIDPLKEGSTEAARQRLDESRGAVARELQGRYVVVESKTGKIPDGFQRAVRAKNRYAGIMLFLLKVPEEWSHPQGGRNFSGFLDAVEAAAKKEGIVDLRRFEVLGNGGQFGFIKPGDKDYPVTVSVGGRVILPDEKIPSEQLARRFRELRMDAEDQLNAAKNDPQNPWKNATGVGLPAEKHSHEGPPLLKQPPLLTDGSEIHLNRYPQGAVRQKVSEGFKTGESEILFNVVSDYYFLTEPAGGVDPKYKNRQGRFRFKWINALFGYTGGDDLLKLKIAIIEQVVRGRYSRDFKIQIGRAVSDDSPDGIQIRLVWNDRKKVPPPFVTQAWGQIQRGIQEVIQEVQDEMNGFLRSYTNGPYGLQVELGWAAAVADLNHHPELSVGQHLEDLQTASLMLAYQREHGAKGVQGFLYRPGTATPMEIASQEKAREELEKIAMQQAVKETADRSNVDSGLEEKRSVPVIVNFPTRDERFHIAPDEFRDIREIVDLTEPPIGIKRRLVEETISGPAWGMLVARYQGRIIGFVSYSEGNGLQIRWIAVHPNYRGQMVGKALMDAVRGKYPEAALYSFVPKSDENIGIYIPISTNKTFFLGVQTANFFG